MKNACFWSAVALVAIVLCLEIVKGSRMRKINEVGRRPIHGHYCGDTFIPMYNSVCRYYSGKRKRSSALIDEKQASSFLHPRAIQSKRSGTNVVEECCTEGCHYEEIHEYC